MFTGVERRLFLLGKSISNELKAAFEIRLGHNENFQRSRTLIAARIWLRNKEIR